MITYGSDGSIIDIDDNLLYWISENRYSEEDDYCEPKYSNISYL